MSIIKSIIRKIIISIVSIVVITSFTIIAVTTVAIVIVVSIIIRSIIVITSIFIIISVIIIVSARCKDYKLIKIYYSVSNFYIDEPPFEEIRINQNNYIKIIKGDYKNFYGQIKDIPIGMLARKDKELGELETMSSSGFQKEGYCSDRHLEELPGFVSVKIMFTGDSPPQQLEEPINISLPVCFFIPLTPEEQINFEKNAIIQEEIKIEEANKEIEDIFKKCEVYETYIKNDSLLEKKSMDEIKEILNEVEKINIEELGKNGKSKKILWLQSKL